MAMLLGRTFGDADNFVSPETSVHVQYRVPNHAPSGMSNNNPREHIPETAYRAMYTLA
jgi:hypothetical protein